MIVVPPVVRLEDLVTGPNGGWAWQEPLEAGLALSVSEPPLRRIVPVGVAMFSAWADFHRRRGQAPSVDASLRSPYAYKVGLLSCNLIGPSASQVESDLFAAAWEDEVNRLGIPDQETRETVRHCLEDLCRNVFQHARTRGGGAHIAASYDPSTRLVSLGVADCGRGIAEDIQENLGPELSDVDAVKLALEPKISGSHAPELNEGVGLYIVRRLALAAEGAFWVRTGRVVARASARDPSAMEPKVTEEGAYWQGTAVAVSFHSGLIDRFQQAIWDIRRSLEGAGPAEVQFFKSAGVDPEWERVHVAPDVRNIALDRTRALELARTEVASRLARDAKLILDFSSTKTSTQAFCYALLGAVARTHGPQLLERVRFVAVSQQVRPLILMALHSGLGERDGDG